MITPTLEDVIQAAIESRVAEIYTTLPGRIESYDATKQTANIKIMVQVPIENLNGDITLETLPTLFSVPVCFEQGGGFFQSFPVQQGDECAVHFSMRDLNEWRRTGECVDPGDIRTHRISGAFAKMGLTRASRKLQSAHADNQVLGKDGGITIHIKDGEIALGSENPSYTVARAETVLQRLETIVTAFNNHTHTAPGGTTGMPGTPILTPQSVSSPTIKVA